MRTVASLVVFSGLVVSCGDKPETGETGEAGPDWHMVAEQVGDVAFLAAWSAGSRLLVVGGDLGADGGHGDLVWIDGREACVEDRVVDQALWWVHGTAEDDWYAVGAAGTILHQTPTGRVDESVATEATLYGVWDDGEGTVWAVGGIVESNLGEIWRRQDGAWTQVAADLDGMMFKVWDEWFVGVSKSFRLVDDAFEEIETDMRMVTVRGRDSEDVWVVGGSSSSEIVKWSAGTWTDQDTTYLGHPLNGIWTAPDETVWVAGNSGTMAYLDGSRWVIPDWPITYQHFHSVWAHDSDIWFLGGNILDAGENFGSIGVYSENDAPLTWSDCPE